MTLQVLDALGAQQALSTTYDSTGQALVGSTSLADPSTGKKAAVSPFGEQLVSNDGVTPCFRACKLAFAPVATPTDMLIFQGSATKTIRIKLIQIGGVATAQGNMPIQLIRRSTAGTLGSAVLTAITAGAHDTANDGSPTAVVSTVGTANYTTPGTQVAILGVGRVNMPAASSGAVAGMLSFDFCLHEDKALILRGTSDYLVINGNGATVPSGGVLDLFVEWEEDAS
jgi:hypothetical protein